MPSDPLTEVPRLYSELASWWLLLSPREEYEQEAETYARLLGADQAPRDTTLLELGSGGGNNASYLKRHFRMTLADRSAEMLEQSRRLNPDCEHVQGDMRTMRLDRRFDRIFVHDAICYMATEADLRAAVATAFDHCAPGGMALFAPDHVRESFVESTDHGGVDGEGRALRYLEWTHDPDPNDSTYTVDYIYALRHGDGSIETVHDRHLEGLFPRELWMQILADAGFEVEALSIEPSEEGPASDLFLARRHAGAVDTSRAREAG